MSCFYWCHCPFQFFFCSDPFPFRQDMLVLYVYCICIYFPYTVIWHFWSFPLISDSLIGIGWMDWPSLYTCQCTAIGAIHRLGIVIFTTLFGKLAASLRCCKGAGWEAGTVDVRTGSNVVRRCACVFVGQIKGVERPPWGRMRLGMDAGRPSLRRLTMMPKNDQLEGGGGINENQYSLHCTLLHSTPNVPAWIFRHLSHSGIIH